MGSLEGGARNVFVQNIYVLFLSLTNIRSEISHQVTISSEGFPQVSAGEHSDRQVQLSHSKQGGYASEGAIGVDDQGEENLKKRTLAKLCDPGGLLQGPKMGNSRKVLVGVLAQLLAKLGVLAGMLGLTQVLAGCALCEGRDKTPVPAPPPALFGNSPFWAFCARPLGLQPKLRIFFSLPDWACFPPHSGIALL